MEYIITFVGSARGNRGEFDQADAYSSMLARESLYFRRIFVVANAIYDQWWNYDSRRKKGISVSSEKNGREELKKCILLTGMIGHIGRQRKYQRKYEQMAEKGQQEKDFRD